MHPLNALLPPAVAREAYLSERDRFHVVAAQLSAAWEQSRGLGHVGSTMKWVSVINRWDSQDMYTWVACVLAILCHGT